MHSRSLTAEFLQIIAFSGGVGIRLLNISMLGWNPASNSEEGRESSLGKVRRGDSASEFSIAAFFPVSSITALPLGCGWR